MDKTSCDNIKGCCENQECCYPSETKNCCSFESDKSCQNSGQGCIRICCECPISEDGQNCKPDAKFCCINPKTGNCCVCTKKEAEFCCPGGKC